MPEPKDTAEKFNKLIAVMKRLRALGGCPWDREQTYLSLRRYIIEEAYELIEAIEDKDIANMTEECGDLLLQVIFVSCMAEERNDFDICNVLDYLTEKLIRRHPHVFGSVNVENSEDVVMNWEQIKVGERKEQHKDASVLAGIPRSLPALLRAYRMQERAAKVGFDWPKNAIEPVESKVDEEIDELKEAIKSNRRSDIEEEMGDAFFALVNLARHLNIDPEIMLHQACAKFYSRFHFVENVVNSKEIPWGSYSLDTLDTLWKEAKLAEKGKAKDNINNN